MNIEEYIASGILELYIAGSLSEKENEEVHEAIQKHPELMAEVESIEKAILQLTAATFQGNVSSFDLIKKQIGQKETKVIPLQKPASNLKFISGWAAAILLGSVLLYNTFQNNQSKSVVASEKEALEAEIKKVSNSLAENEKLLEIIRDKDVISVPLAGQNASPTSYAKVYWNKKTQNIYLDVKGLPPPPKGKVYQVWSLKITPLTPTSLGTLDTFTASASKIFTIKNLNQSEAFGITLEPEGGSSSPSLDQLYALGTVSS
jgi:anti-sigma-K factor RskA